MASTATASKILFIDTALNSPITTFTLSYTDSAQKWLIRRHLLSLIQEYPTFSPSVATFVHSNGTSVNLLNATGNLTVSSSTPPVPLTVWLHECYPQHPPMLFVSPKPSNHSFKSHPFVDTSGSVMTPYLQTWRPTRSNLSDLIHNLLKLFSIDHPFCCFSPTITSFDHPSLVSKMEALDRLSGALHYDVAAIRSETEQEIEVLTELQVELGKREDIATSIILGLEHEKLKLEQKDLEFAIRINSLTHWLDVNGDLKPLPGADAGETGDVFEAADEESKLAMDCLAADSAIDDLIWALQKAVEERVLSSGVYLKLVRSLAREQFAHRAKLLKLKRIHLLDWALHRSA